MVGLMTENAENLDAKDRNPATHNAALPPEAARLREVLVDVLDALRSGSYRLLGLTINEWRTGKRERFFGWLIDDRRLYDALVAADALLNPAPPAGGGESAT